MAAFNRRELDSMELEGGIAPAAIAIGRREERRETTETPGRRRHDATREHTGTAEKEGLLQFRSAPWRRRRREQSAVK